MTRLARDIDLAHRRRWPSRPLRLVTRSWLLVSSPCLHLLLIHRIVYWLHAKRKLGGWRAWLGKAVLVPLALPKWAIQINAKSEIPCGAGVEIDIAGGISMPEQGHIIFGPRTVGSGTVIGARVTVGRGLADGGRPEIGRNVWIGSDCVVYGAISIGDGATLLPGTVLTKSIPAGVVMHGNPARVVLRNFDNSELRSRQDVDALQYVNIAAQQEA